MSLVETQLPLSHFPSFGTSQKCIGLVGLE